MNLGTSIKFWNSTISRRRLLSKSFFIILVSGFLIQFSFLFFCRSLLLNVVKAELPSLELAQNKLTLLDATVYLQDYLDGNLPESVNIMSQPEVSKLKCNADFSIISRNESCPEGAELTEREKSLRIIQMHRRLTGSQHHIHFWGNFLCESYNAAYSHLISYLETLEFEDKSKEYLKFSQSIQVSTSFSRLHNKLLSLNARIFLNLQNSVSSINSFQEQEDIISLSEKLNECVVETNEYFMLMHKAAAEGEIGKIRWYLSDISFFMKGAIPVISLAVQSMFSKFSSAFGEVAKNAFLGLSESTVENMEFLCISATSDIQNGVFYVIAYNWIVLLGKVHILLKIKMFYFNRYCQSLGNLEKQLTKAKDSAVPDPHLLENIVDSFFLESWIGVDYHLNTKVILDTAVFRKHASMTCKKLTESNKLTMERLDTLLSERINILLTTCKEITKV